MSRGLAALNFVTLLQYDTGVFAAVFYFGYHPHKGRWGDDMVNLHFTGLSKSYGARTVLDNISGCINPADKIGLVGKNGVGKTTLARILAGREARDEGQIEASPPRAKILYLEQYPVFGKEDTVYQVVLEAARGNPRLQDADKEVQKTLNRLGIGAARWGQRANSLSGGEKTKLSLCRILVSDFDLLLLDEPTNHLDLDNCEWLEDFLAKLTQPLVVISHDRYFLDRVVNKIWELTSQGLQVYEGNYSVYRRQREIEERTLEREYEKQQQKIRHLKQVINERRNWYQKAHTAAGTNDFYRSKAKKHASVLKAKERELERLEKEKVAKPTKLPAPAFAVLNKNVRGKSFPRVLLRGEKVGKAFGEKVLFQDVSFTIRRGDKIALIGPNGAGKTTLLKIIAGCLADYEGKVRVNPSVKIGYFAQELDNLNPAASVLDEVLTGEAVVEEARLLLACLLFRRDAVYKRIGDLSMGEKGRVAFAKLILSGANFLVLDEPTNYMDIESREAIEEALADFGGSFIFVTHDRYFMGLANRIFALEAGKLRCYHGNYEYYLAKKREETGRDRAAGQEEDVAANIIRLECELAYLGGKLDESKDEEEKERLEARFLQVARELNHYKKLR